MVTSKSLLGRVWPGALSKEEFLTCNQVAQDSLNKYHVRERDILASLGSLLSLIFRYHPTGNFGCSILLSTIFDGLHRTHFFVCVPFLHPCILFLATGNWVRAGAQPSLFIYVYLDLFQLADSQHTWVSVSQRVND